MLEGRASTLTSFCALHVGSGEAGVQGLSSVADGVSGPRTVSILCESDQRRADRLIGEPGLHKRQLVVNPAIRESRGVRKIRPRALLG